MPAKMGIARVLSTILIALAFSLCATLPQKVDLAEIDSFEVKKIEENVNGKSYEISFGVENSLRSLQLIENESEVAIYANGIMVSELVNVSRSLEKGSSEIVAQLKLNNSSLRQWWVSHIKKGENTEISRRIFVVYDLGGRYLRLFDHSTKNLSTDLLPKFASNSCGLELKTSWGKVDENETEILFETNRRISVSLQVNQAILLEKVLGLGNNSLKIDNLMLAEKMGFRNVFRWIVATESCENFEKSVSVELI